jgi:hypothetical protein
MLLVATSLRPSPIHGLGCFTTQRIRRGQVVWIYDPRIDLRLTLSALGALPETARAFFHHYGYVDMQRGEPAVTLCADNAKHMNHSATPNVVNGEDDDGAETNVAARDIEAGEELTCDYFSFDLDAERKLGRRLVAHSAPR